MTRRVSLRCLVFGHDHVTVMNGPTRAVCVRCGDVVRPVAMTDARVRFAAHTDRAAVEVVGDA